MNRPEETRTSLVGDGWCRTGDVAKMDENGYIYIVDRTKDMINVGGLKVYPREVDDTLCEHPAVMMAATVGLTDPDRPGSERIKAFVVLKQGYEGTGKMEQELIQFVKDRISPYKVPKYIEFRKELPLTLIGKVVKVSLEKKKRPKRQTRNDAKEMEAFIYLISGQLRVVSLTSKGQSPSTFLFS